MALSISALSAGLRSAMLVNAETLGAIDGEALTALCDVIASEVINHITNNAVVTVPATGLVDSTMGAVTGSASGTIS